MKRRASDALGFNDGEFVKGPRIDEADLANQVAAARASLKAQTQDLHPSKEVSINKELVAYLMTAENASIIFKETGAEVDWIESQAKARLVGNPDQVKQAERMLSRVAMHCHWGASEAKVTKLLKRRPVESMKCRLAPMTVGNALKPVEKTFGGTQTTSLTIGKGKGNDVVVEETTVSRHHCEFSFDATKGCVYVADLSTNGTYLNGKRLPSKKLGKVMLSHGDELLLKAPGTDDEFGYNCNLEELYVPSEVKLVMLRKPTGDDHIDARYSR